MEDAVEAAKLIVSAHDDPNCSVHAYMKVKNKALSVIGTVGLARALLSSSERVKELEAMLERESRSLPSEARRLAIEEAAKVVEPTNGPPCDCIALIDDEWWVPRCDCRNGGDSDEAQSWCTSKNEARRIRALIDRKE